MLQAKHVHVISIQLVFIELFIYLFILWIVFLLRAYDAIGVLNRASGIAVIIY